MQEIQYVAGRTLTKEFEQRVHELQQTGMSGTAAMSKARRESPSKIAALEQTMSMATDDHYEALVAAEIGGSGMPRYVAEQRLIQKYGGRRPDPAHASQIRKSAAASDDFNRICDTIQKRDGGSHQDAMRKARREYPDAFEQFQRG
jgi:hypothetical protein